MIDDKDICCDCGLSVDPVKSRETLEQVFARQDPNYPIYWYDPLFKTIIKGASILPHEPDYGYVSQLLYIGNEDFYENFVKKHGITEFFSNGNGRVACVGVNRETKSWCGWSHRGHGKFFIGYRVVEESMLSEVIAAGYSPQTEEHCKHLAHVFADLMR